METDASATDQRSGSAQNGITARGITIWTEDRSAIGLAQNTEIGWLSRGYATVAEARLKPNDLTLPDIGHHSLAGVPSRANAIHR